jgi:hypothetical protein
MIAATRTLADPAADGCIHSHGRTLTTTDSIKLHRLADRALQRQPAPDHPSTP